jgi:hypothetical protein
MCFSCKKADDHIQNCKVNGVLTAKLEDTVRCEGCIDYTPSKTMQSITQKPAYAWKILLRLIGMIAFLVWGRITK